MTVVRAPARHVTALAFGGSRLDELYVTSACLGYREPELHDGPLAGALLRFSPGVTGHSLTHWRRI